MLHAQNHAENIGVERRGIALRGLLGDRADLAFGAGIIHRDIEAAKPDTEPGLEKWLGINAEYARAWPNISVKKEPPQTPRSGKEWPVKSRIFSPNPGAGD